MSSLSGALTPPAELADEVLTQGIANALALLDLDRRRTPTGRSKK